MYVIDKSRLKDNILSLDINDNLKYFLEISQTSDGSDVWTFNSINLLKDNSFEYFFILSKEIFESDYLEVNNINKVFLMIEDDNRDELNKKTESFINLIKDKWNFKVEEEPETQVEGGYSYINYNTNSILITKKEKEVENLNINVIKFCPECGLENNNYKFCPNCGTNLKQA